MTIKEVEERTGMTRANVRFYEQEGLLTPGRGENGYRDYSEADVETLKRIKLLRSIHMPLDGIREIHQGKRELTDALRDLMADLERERTDTERSHAVCRVIFEDGARYSTLDAQYYLDRMEGGEREPVTVPEADAVSGADAVPREYIPWRRFWARTLDFALCSICGELVLAIVFHVNVTDRSVIRSIIDKVLAYVFMLSAEPVLLACLGTTPGKWILGIRVAHPDGRRLAWGEAAARTWKVCVRGMGLSVPLYDLFRYWRSYKDYQEGWSLDWEEDSVVSRKDECFWRIAAYIGAWVMAAAATAAAARLSAAPPERGELTVAEFCRNYNHYAGYYNVDRTYSLDENGKWVKRETAGQEVIVEVGNMPQPAFVFTESNGKMTGMEFAVKLEDKDFPVTNYSEFRALAVSAFVKAQDSYHVFSAEENKLIERMAEDSFESYSLEACGISVECEIEYSGYVNVGTLYLVPERDCRREYSIRFAMKKTEP